MKEFDEMVRQERLAYHKQWRASNKDKVKQHNEKYWRKRVELKLLKQQRTEIGTNEEITEYTDNA